MRSYVGDEMLVNNFLPDKLALLALDVLRELSEGERDFIRIVVEVIQEIRVPGDEDDDEQTRQDPDASLEMDTPSVARTPRPKPREEMTEQERDRQDRLDMRCLCLCEGVLERVNEVSLSLLF